MVLFEAVGIKQKSSLDIKKGHIIGSCPVIIERAYKAKREETHEN